MFSFVKSREIKISLTDEDWTHIASKKVIGQMIPQRHAFAYDIYWNKDLIGFVLCRKYKGGVFIWQYAIDKDSQHNGYGYAALKALLEKLKAEKNVDCFTITYTYGDERAKRLYEKLGFMETDVVDEDGIHEVNMELRI